MTRVLHTADWHFREKDHDEIKKCLDFTIQKGIEYQPDVIIIAADITHSKSIKFDSRSIRTIFDIISALMNIAPVAVITGTDSHDGKVALGLKNCRGKYPILVSDTFEQWCYTKRQGTYGSWVPMSAAKGCYPEFIVTQMPQPTKRYFVNDMSIEDSDKAISTAMQNIFAAFGAQVTQFQDIPHIANGHFQVGGAYISETQQLSGRDIEVSKSQLAMLNADVVALGHIHKPQDMGNGIFYSGSPTRMTYGETEKKGFYIHDIKYLPSFSPDFDVSLSDQRPFELSSEFIQTPAREMIGAKFDLTKESSQIPISVTLESLAESLNADFDSYHVKIEIKAWQDEATDIKESKIRTLFESAGAESVKVSITRVPRETVRAIKVLEAETLPGKLKAMAELRGEEVKNSVLDKAAGLEASEDQPWIKTYENIIKKGK